MPDPLTRVPLEIVENTTVAWRWEHADFAPGDGWTLDYAFEGPQELDVSATVDDDGFLVELTEAQTALTPGAYRWQAFASRPGPPSERVQVGAGRMEVVQDLEAATGLGEEKSWLANVVEALEAYVLGVATSGQLRMSINGRSIERIPLMDARKLLNGFRRELKAETASLASGRKPGSKRRIRVAF